MRRALALAVAVLALAAPGAAAATDCPKTTLGDIEDEVMCPICGTPLGLATESPQAQQQREYIEGLIAECKSKDEIKAALVRQFGSGVLALPGDGDDDDLGDVLVYVIPALAAVLALGGIAFAATRWRRRPPPPSGPGAEAAGARGRLDADLERYEL